MSSCALALSFPVISQEAERTYINARKVELRRAAVAAEKLDQARSIVATTEAAIAAMELQVRAARDTH